jgi:hypothetical protein
VDKTSSLLSCKSAIIAVTRCAHAYCPKSASIFVAAYIFKGPLSTFPTTQRRRSSREVLIKSPLIILVFRLIPLDALGQVLVHEAHLTNHANDDPDVFLKIAKC